MKELHFKSADSTLNSDKKVVTSKFVTLEGAPFSGKTTLIKKLQDQYGVQFVHEYAKFANSGKDFPAFPSLDLEQAKKSVRFMIEIEKRRCEEAINKAVTTNLPVIMDRSPLSCIVFQKAVEIIHPDYPSVYAYSIEAFQSAYEEGKIFSPQVLVYMLPPDERAFKERVYSRGQTPIDMFNKPECGKIMEMWYKHCVATCFNQLNARIIPSNHNLLENNVDLVSKFIFESADYSGNPYLNLHKLLKN